MSTQMEMTTGSIGVLREIFILGEKQIVREITQALAPLNFLVHRQPSELSEPRNGLHFIVAVCDFQDIPNMQIVARSLSKVDSTDAHKIIYATEPAALDQQHLLFAIELGARFTVSGGQKKNALKDYIKRIALSAQNTLGLSALETELEQCRATRDDAGMQRVADKLARFPKDHEEVLRLQALASRYLRLVNKAVFYLRRMLTINPQNLWAASELGRMYLRSNRVAEGVEVLEKLSEFHDLNSERVLVLGDAYLDQGRLTKAERAFNIGAQMIGDSTDDQRFQNGLAKVKVAEGDIKSALAVLGRPVLSEEVLAFINMRAILAIKNGQVQDGIRFYQMALEGCRDDQVVRSKLYFNIGLACAKIKDDEGAVEALQKSVDLGGDSFTRARGPLEIAQRALVRRQSRGTQTPRASGDSQPQTDLDTFDQVELDDLEAS